MKVTKVVGMAIAALAFSSGALLAEPAAKADDAAKAATTKAATAKADKAAKKDAKSAKSKECSAQADAQKLHGKPRKDFRKTCMKGAAPAAH